MRGQTTWGQANKANFCNFPEKQEKTYLNTGKKKRMWETGIGNHKVEDPTYKRENIAPKKELKVQLDMAKDITESSRKTQLKTCKKQGENFWAMKRR